MANFVSADVFINEFLPDSNFTGAQDKFGEWIELYNNGSALVNLNNWNISENSGTNFTINTSITIPSQGFVVLAYNLTFFNEIYPDVNVSGIKIIEYGSVVSSWVLNNGQDNISLYNASGDLIDSFLNFADPGENVSIGRYPDGNSNNFNFTALTPGDNNDNAAPVFNKWVAPSLNSSFIAGLFNITVNITDAVHPVNISIMEFNNSNTTMNRSGDLFYFALNTSLFDDLLYNNLTIYFNDSVGLSNTDILFNITVDNTKPNITAPQTNANARNFVSKNSVFNASVNATDLNLLNVTCALSGTTVGNFSTDGNIHYCNLTAPSTEGDFEITFTAIDKAGNINTTTHNFTTNNVTTGTLTPLAVTVSDLNQSDKTVQVNVTLENSGNNPMYDTGVILQEFSADQSFSVAPVSYQSCSLNLSPGQNCNVTFNVTVDGGLTGSHSIFWNRNWTNNDFTQVQFATFVQSDITISSNPQMTTAPNISSTISHGENSTISLDINSTGNADLDSVTVTFTPDTVQSSWLNVTTFNFGTISATTNVTLDVNVTVPKYTNPGNYTGTFTIAATSTTSKSILLTVEVPTDDSWTSFQNNNVTYSRSDKAGLVGNFTINNTGNIGHNFTFYPPTGNFFSWPNLWNNSNIRDIYVERGQTEIVSIYHRPMSGSTSESVSSFNLTFTTTSQNTSQTNTTFMSLVRDDSNPNVNVTNPTNNSFVKGDVEFNVSASDLNLSNIEFYINNILVFDDVNFTNTFNWSTTSGSYPDAVYALKAIAYDGAGNFNLSNINVTVNNTDDDPILITDIQNITIVEDDNATLNLSLFFKSLDGEVFDGQDFKYNFTQPDNVTVHVNNVTQIANFTPVANFTGINNITFTAIDSSSNTTSSNLIVINVTNVNDAPTTPALTSPESGFNVTSSAGNAVLRWNASLDVDNDDITYYVFVSNDSNDITFNATATLTTLSLTNLNANETYFWKVLASDNSLNSSNSSIFNFTMIRDRSPLINAWIWNNTINSSSISLIPFVAEDKTLNFTINASDPDDDPINFTWFRDNVEISNVGNFSFNLTDNFTAAGTYTLKLEVQDNNSNSAEQEWTVTVTNTNREPVLDAISDITTATEDTELRFNITAIDPDNNTLTFTSNITSISFTNDANNSLTTVSWTPTNEYVGTNSVNFTVNDSLIDSQVVLITVANTNDAPTITEFFPTENKTISDGIGSQLFNVTFSDIDIGNNATAYWFRNTTNNIASNSSNVTVTGLSTGIYNITAIVNDTSGTEAKYEWILTVTTGIIFDGLTSPVLSGLNQSERENVTDVMINHSTFGGIDFGNETMNFSRVANLDDAFNVSNGLISVDTVTYPELNRNASIVLKGLNFTKAPLIYNASGFENTEGNICPEDICTNVTYDAANGILRFNVPHFSTYFTQTNVTNGVPLITSTPVLSASENAAYNYNVDATDPDGDTLIFSLISNPSGMSISSTSGLISWTPTTAQLGLNNVTVNVSDSNLTALQSFNISVGKGPKLIISDLDVKVDGKSDKNLNNNTKIGKDAAPGTKVEFKLEIENMFTDDEDLEIEDIDVEITIEDIDDGDDLDEDADEFDLKQGKNEDLSIEFEMPLEIDEGIYDVIIIVEGDDENSTTHEILWNLELEVEKETHEVRIIRADVTPSTLACQRQVSINTEIINTGTDDEDEVVLEITSPEIGINSVTSGIELDEGTEDNRFKKEILESISADILPGTYPITISAHYDSTLSEEKTINLNVDECELTKTVKKDVKEKKPAVEVIRPPVVIEAKPAPETFSSTDEYKTLLAVLVVLFLGTAVFVIGAGYIVLKK